MYSDLLAGAKDLGCEAKLDRSSEFTIGIANEGARLFADNEMEVDFPAHLEGKLVKKETALASLNHFDA